MIRFTQFLRPDGRQVETTIDRPPEIEAMASAVVAQGVRLEIEVLRTGEVSLEAVDLELEDSLACELCDNGPEVPEAVDRLVREAHRRLQERQA